MGWRDFFLASEIYYVAQMAVQASVRSEGQLSSHSAS